MTTKHIYPNINMVNSKINAGCGKGTSMSYDFRTTLVLGKLF